MSHQSTNSADNLGRGSPAEADCSVLLPIEWQARNRKRETRIATEALLEALLAFSAPVSLSFVLRSSRAERASGGWIVSAIDVQSAFDAAHVIKSTARALNAWQGLGEPIPYQPPEPGPSTFDITVSEGAGRQIVNARSAPWMLAQQQDVPTTMVIELRGNCAAADQPSLRCAISISGDGPANPMIATLLAADPPGRVRLEANPRLRPTDQPPELPLPLPMVAHLVSSPARMPDAWPTQPVTEADRFIELVEHATPPHVALFGGSGQGKTTLMEHLVASSLSAGNSVVVICPHGDLAARAAAIAHQQGSRFEALDFADSDHCPRWNLCIPPAGVAPTQWAAEMVGIIRAAWHDMPEEYFGPVWSKSMRAALSVLIRDPQGQHPLTELTSVMHPPLQEKWRRVLGRIDDRVLSQEVSDLHQCIANDSNKSWGFWAAAKLEPFIADDRLRRVIDHRRSKLDLSVVLEGLSLIMSVPMSALGDEGASLVAGTMLSQIWHLVRQHPGSSESIDIFIDESHRIPSAVLAEMLAEGRKFGVRLRLATQSPHQLDNRARDAMLNNTGCVGTFRTGPMEAAYIDPMFPSTPAGSLNRLKRHWLAITNGEDELVGPTAPPITSPGDRTAIVAANRRRHQLEETLREPDLPPEPDFPPMCPPFPTRGDGLGLAWARGNIS